MNSEPVFVPSPRSPFSVRRLALSPDCDHIVMADERLLGRFRVVDADRDGWIGTSAPVLAVRFLDGDRWLLVDGEDAAVNSVSAGDDAELEQSLGGLAVAASATADQFATVHESGDVVLWDAATLAELARAHFEGAVGVHLSDEGLAVWSNERLWLLDHQLTQRAVLQVAAIDARLAARAVCVRTATAIERFTWDGDAVGRTEVAARVWDVSSAGLLCAADSEGQITAFDLEGRALWSRDFGGAVSVVQWHRGHFWVGERGVVGFAERTGDPRALGPGPVHPVSELHCAPGAVLAGTGRTWWLAGAGGAQELPPTDYVHAAPLGQFWLFANQHGLWVRRSDGGVEREISLPESLHPTSVIGSSDGTLIFVGGSVGQLACLNAETGEVLWRRVGHSAVVGRLRLSDDGALLLSATLSDVPRLWDAQTGVRQGPLQWYRNDVSGVAFQGRTVATLHTNGVVRWWGEAGVLEAEVGSGLDRTLVLGGGPRWVAVTGRLAYAIALVERGGEVRTVPGHEGLCLSLAFRDDGALISGGDDGTVFAWDVEQAEHVGNTTIPPTPVWERPVLQGAAVDPPTHECLAVLLGTAADDPFVVTAAPLGCPSGRLVVADPHEAAGASTIELVPGTFEVLVAADPEYGEVAGALVRIAPGEPVRWTSAFGLRGTKPLGAAVDSAALVIVDATWAAEVLDSGPGGTELLPPDWREHRLRHGTAERGLVHIRTGSDGGFPVYIGHGPDGPVVAFLPIG